MNFKFSLAIAAAFLMLASVANAQSGSRSAAPVIQSVPSAVGSSTRSSVIQAVPSTVGSSTRAAAPVFQSAPVGSSTRTSAPVFQSAPVGSSTRSVAPVQSFGTPVESFGTPVQSFSPSTSSGCCQSYSVPTYSAPTTRSWGGGWWGRRHGCGY